MLLDCIKTSLGTIEISETIICISYSFNQIDGVL